MKKIKIMMATILVIGIAMLISLAILNNQEYDSKDIDNAAGEETVLLHDLSNYCSKYWTEEKNNFTKYMKDFVKREHKHPFCIMDTQNEVRFSHGNLKVTTLHEVYKKHYLTSDILVDGNLVGKVIIRDEVYENLSIYKQRFYNILYIYLFLSLLTILVCIFYIKKNMIEPFHRLKNFASQIAQGNLDIPLAKEDSDLFGDFTESFDIMREELFQSKMREEAERKKKEELSISLNHDIKAPISAIKAIAELMELKISKDKATKDELQKKIGEINEKATQTDILVNNMLNVSIDVDYDYSPRMDYYYTDELLDVLKCTDYREKINLIQMENCLIRTDVAKLTQVFDNCIANSYKYADTPIHIYGKIAKNNQYCISIKDMGTTLDEDEVENICIKYYRGKNSLSKDGSGLGLHACKLMMERMEGVLYCQQDPDGFCVKLYLPM